MFNSNNPKAGSSFWPWLGRAARACESHFFPDKIRMWRFFCPSGVAIVLYKMEAEWQKKNNLSDPNFEHKNKWNSNLF